MCGDDEVLARSLNFFLSLIVSRALLMPVLVSARSSLTFASIGPSFSSLRVPRHWNSPAGHLFVVQIYQWPDHASLLFLILSTSVSNCPNSSRITSLRILSRLVLPAIFSPLESSIRLSAVNTNTYISAGVTNALYSFVFVLVDMLLVFHILLNLPNIADARQSYVLYLLYIVHVL